MAANIDSILAAPTAKAVLLIRILVGWVFLSEGMQKFLFPESLGVGCFVKTGIPWPQVMAPFVGVVEVVCGTLLLIGLLTRLVAIPLLIDIRVASYSTKIVTLAKNGLWSTLHDARTDISILLGLLFLLIVGGGAWSLELIRNYSAPRLYPRLPAPAIMSKWRAFFLMRIRFRSPSFVCATITDINSCST